MTSFGIRKRVALKFINSATRPSGMRNQSRQCTCCLESSEQWANDCIKHKSDCEVFDLLSSLGLGWTDTLDKPDFGHFIAILDPGKGQ